MAKCIKLDNGENFMPSFLAAGRQTCFKKKRLMDATITLWLIAFLLGSYLYLTVTHIILNLTPEKNFRRSLKS